MSIYSDHPIRLVGNVAHFTSVAGDSRTLQPGDFFDLVGEVAGGTVKLTVEGLDFHTPSFVREVHPRPPEGPEVETWFNCVRLHVELYRDEALVRQWTTPSGSKREGDQELEAQADAGEFGAGHSRWRLRVENRSRKVVAGFGAIGFVRDTHPILQERLPLRVLNGAFNVVLTALAPYAVVHGSFLRFGFSQEVADFLNLQGDHPLRERTFDIRPEHWALDRADGELQEIRAEVVPGTRVRQAVQERWQQMDAKLAAVPIESMRNALRKKNDEWRDEWLGKIHPAFVAVHFTFVLTDIDISTDIIPGWDIGGSVEDISIELFLAFQPRVASSDYVLFFASADYEGSAELAESLGQLEGLQDVIDEKLTPHIQELMPLIHRYFAEVLVRMAPLLSEIPAIFIEAWADEDAVLVRWTYDSAGWGRVRDIVTDVRRFGTLPPITVTDRGPRGAVPDGFALGDSTSVVRLDRIETIVVVMMENRSFDHMLGHLRADRGEKYRGFPDHASNSYQEHGFTHHVRMLPITQFLRDKDLLQIPTDPFHSTSHVAAQIADGAMSGFAQDVLPRGEAQTVLTYYTREHIPNYYTLADEYLICDHWFSAHPGGTYPNRWATLGATMPELNNIHVDDPRLGFIRDATIFDLLSEEGIGWHYYENNVSMIRMYARYRLDDKNVLPYADTTEGFEAKAAANALPPVVFVEPRITGVPPLAQASDDHPPANLAVGQEFIATVYNALASSPEQWRRSLLLITYDEHGGFYDHVPPPGTLLGPPEWRDKVPKLRPDGPDFMGPRVPTFVISPYVDAGTVSNAVFDHMSIIKTILVRHRKQLFADQFQRFPSRVAMANHLGAALNRDDARPVDPVLLPAPPRRGFSLRTVPAATRPGAPRRRPTASPTDDEEARDFRLSLARAMLPKRR